LFDEAVQAKISFVIPLRKSDRANVNASRVPFEFRMTR
jgi:hypothetical protein